MKNVDTINNKSFSCIIKYESAADISHYIMVCNLKCTTNVQQMFNTDGINISKQFLKKSNALLIKLF